MTGVVDLHERLSLFSEHWSPKVVARLNDYAVKVVKLKGEFVWHSHPETDELFLVVEGTLVIQLRDGGREQHVTLGPGSCTSSRKGSSTGRLRRATSASCWWSPRTQ
jgi:mannose-6-phosphate isomerase-like protein (cupin superfamily)